MCTRSFRMDPFRYLLGPDDPRPKTRHRRHVRGFKDFAAEYTAPARAWLILDGLEEDDAADVVQSALLALWERRADVPRRAWPMWLLSAILLRRIALYRFRAIRQKHAPRVAWETEIDAQEATADPEEKLGSAEASALLNELLGALRPERKAIVQAYLLEELSMQEAAKKLQIALPTAWDRWRRAKQDLVEQVVRRRRRERFKAGTESFAVLFLLLEQLRTWLRRPLDARTAPHDSRQPAPWLSLVLAGVLSAAATGHVTPLPWRGASSAATWALARAAGATLASSSGPVQRSLTSWILAAAERSDPLPHAAPRGVCREPGALSATCAPRPPEPASPPAVTRGAPASPEAGQGDAEERLAGGLTARMLHVRIAGAAQVLGERKAARSLLDEYEHRYPDRPYANFHKALAKELRSP